MFCFLTFLLAIVRAVIRVQENGSGETGGNRPSSLGNSVFVVVAPTTVAVVTVLERVGIPVPVVIRLGAPIDNHSKPHRSPMVVATAARRDSIWRVAAVAAVAMMFAEPHREASIRNDMMEEESTTGSILNQ